MSDERRIVTIHLNQEHFDGTQFDIPGNVVDFGDGYLMYETGVTHQYRIRKTGDLLNGFDKHIASHYELHLYQADYDEETQ